MKRAACLAFALLHSCWASATPDQQVVDSLLSARSTHRATPPPSSLLPGLTVQRAYTIQNQLTRSLESNRGRVAGYKCGFTSAAAQKAFGADEPAWGAEFDFMKVRNGGVVRLTDFVSFRLELEVAFTIDRDVPAGVHDPRAIRRYVRFAHAAFELPDLRFSAKPTVADIVADAVAANRFVLGPPHRVSAVDVDAITAELRHDGKRLFTAPATAALGSPWNVLAWLNQSLAAHGRCLRAGDVVLTGSLGPPHAPQGDLARGRYLGDMGPLGRVTCTVR